MHHIFKFLFCDNAVCVIPIKIKTRNERRTVLIDAEESRSGVLKAREAGLWLSHWFSWFSGKTSALLTIITTTIILPLKCPWVVPLSKTLNFSCSCDVGTSDSDQGFPVKEASSFVKLSWKINGADKKPDEYINWPHLHACRHWSEISSGNGNGKWMCRIALGNRAYRSRTSKEAQGFGRQTWTDLLMEKEKKTKK